MDKLPPEIYDRIIMFVDRFVIKEISMSPSEPRRRDIALNYPSIATVSRKFQASVESETFRSLFIQATESGLDQFERILTPRRRTLLHFLHVDPEIMSYYSRLHINYAIDAHSRDEAVTRSLRRLFSILAATNNGDSHRMPKLDLQIYSLDRSSSIPYQRLMQGQFFLINLASDATDFPSLPCVHRFSFRSTPNLWNPRVASLLTAKMVNATSVNWELIRFEGDSFLLGQLYRNELVDSVESTPLPASVAEFS
ncbi:hypothetical protein F5Y02DRAFT_415978 [Annulohypoxylon stygium]|nr:hypothetical protein F5Y02DRAFT_415978 [Annulohypoxylon stygium]